MSKARKQMRRNDHTKLAKFDGEGIMRECAHPPCKEKTTDQFCIACSLQIGALGKPPGEGKRGVANGKGGRRIYSY